MNTPRRFLLSSLFLALPAAPLLATLPGALDPTLNGTGMVKVVLPIGTGSNPYFAFGGLGPVLGLQPSDGKVLLAGTYKSSTNPATMAIFRYKPDGTGLDTSFGVSGAQVPVTPLGSEGRVLATQADGNILVGGSYFTGRSNDLSVTRFTPLGKLDTHFLFNGTLRTDIKGQADSVAAMVVQADGKILVGGAAGIGTTTSDCVLSRYTPTNGILDTKFGVAGHQTYNLGANTASAIDQVAVAPDGMITATAHNLLASSYQYYLLHFTAAGVLDTNFNATTPGKVLLSTQSAPAVQKNGQIVVLALGGSLQRYKLDGTVDSSFGGTGSVTPDLTATAVAVQRNDKILVAGFVVDGSNKKNFAVERYTADGALDATFGTAGVVTVSLSSGDDVGLNVFLQADGKIVVTGSVAGSVDAGVVRLFGDEVPTIIVSASSATEDTTVSLNGSVNPNNDTTTAKWEYGTTINYGTTVPITLSPGNDGTVQAISTPLTGLTPSTKYFYRLTATNSIGSSVTTGTFTTPPTLTITAPAANVTIKGGTEGGTVALTGRSDDAKGIVSIQYSLNNGAFVDTSTLTLDATGATFSQNLTPKGGLNNLQVRVAETGGTFSAVTAFNFTYEIKSPLSVPVVANGTVKGALPGDVYLVGGTYTLVAVPAAGYVFNGWTGAGLTSPTKDVATLTFVFSDALAQMPTITPSYILNPFTTAIVGNFNGLVKADGAVTPSNETNGFVTFTVTGTGSFSGLLKIDGLTLKLSGLFNNSGNAVFGPSRSATVAVARPNKPSLVLGNVVLVDIGSPGGHTITGTLDVQTRTGTQAMSTFTADRAAFAAKTPIPVTNTNQGSYTVYFPAQAQTNGLTTSDFPQGSGIGSLTVSAAGVATLSGVLADGAAVTASAPISASFTAPLFAQLYTANGGSFGGAIKLDNTASETDVAGDTGSPFLWFKPYVGGEVYPYGWMEGVSVKLRGAKYAIPAAATHTSVMPGLTYTVNPDAELDFSQGKLTGTLTKHVNISTTSVATKSPTTDTSFTIALVAKTGRFSGTFNHPDGTKPAYYGVIYQKTGYSGGFGFFLTPTPKVVDGTGESGVVVLSPAH